MPDGYVRFLDAEGHFSIGYPQDWRHEGEINDVFHPPGIDAAAVIVSLPTFRFLPPPSPRQQIDEDLNFLDAFPGSRVLKRGSTRLAGYPASYVHWIDTSSGEEVEIYKVLTNGDGSGRAYSVILDGEPKSVESLRPEYELMVETFEIADRPDDGLA